MADPLPDDLRSRVAAILMDVIQWADMVRNGQDKARPEFWAKLQGPIESLARDLAAARHERDEACEYIAHGSDKMFDDTLARALAAENALGELCGAIGSMSGGGLSAHVIAKLNNARKLLAAHAREAT